MKPPLRLYGDTLAFYRDTLGLEVIETDAGATVPFGSVRLHLDRLPHQSQTDIWLQVEPDDPAAAADWLDGHDLARCDEVETLPEGFSGFWIAAPSGVIHLVVATAEAAG